MRLQLLCLLAVFSGAPRLGAAETSLLIDDQQSRIDIVVKATVDSFVGKLKAFSPVVTVTDDGEIGSARLAFRFRDVLTGKDRRDAAMHKWQDTDRFPDGLFVLTALEPSKSAAAIATGQLTLHGVTRGIQFPVAVARDGQRFAIDGDAAVDTREFGLPKIRMLGLLTVDPVVHVRFHLQGVPTNAVARRP